MPSCIEVDKKLAEKTIKLTRAHGIYDENYLVYRHGEKVLIPVTLPPGEEVTIDNSIYRVIECNPPAKKRVSIDLPAHDVIGDVVIVRENILSLWSTSELIEAIRQVYPRVKAIWVKEYTTDEFRKPVLTLIWGEEKREVTAKEHGLLFKVKLGDVYYNPRLSEEHHRLAMSVHNGEVVIDLFSGIGGFAIHIASQRYALIIANDLNPHAYELLVENINLNKKKLKGTLIPLNEDAEVIPDILRRSCADRIIADLPIWSTRYAHVYTALLKPHGILHLYRLSRDEEMLLEELRTSFPGWNIVSCRLILEYAPRAGIFRCDLIKPKDI